MDDNVIKALDHLIAREWAASLENYLRFLDLAADWAFELQTAADMSERRLLQIDE